MTDKNDTDLMMKIGSTLLDAKQKIREANALMDQLDPENVVDLKITFIADISVNGKPVVTGLVGDTGDMMNRTSEIVDKIIDLQKEADNDRD